MTAGIYIFQHLESGKQYIGQSIDVEKRIKQHLRDVKRRKYRCPKFYKALRKYGPEGFEIRRIEFKPEMMTFLKENLDLVERTFIKLYGTVGDAGYNLTLGGEGGAKSEETRRKMSEAKKNMSEETKRRMSEAHKNSEKTKAHLSRLHASPEHKEHLARLHSDPEFQQKRAEQLARLHSDPEFQQKNRERLARLNADPENRKKLSEAKKNSEKTKAHLARLHSDPEYQQKRADHLARLHASPEHKEQLARLHQSQRKLTPEQIQRVFQMKEEGLSQQKIADHFIVSQTAISYILSGKRYQDLQKTGETK